MKVAIGSDHAGFSLKETIEATLVRRGFRVEDVGTDGTGSVDYPDFAFEVGRRVASGQVEYGVLVCGTGIGMSIAANKVAGVRAAVCADVYSARLARAHNNANVVCVGARITGDAHAVEIVASFLDAAFEGGRHARRVEKIKAVEGESRSVTADGGTTR